MKKRVLFVGESPLGQSGNSRMMKAILEQVDKDEFSPVCFAARTPNLILEDSLEKLPYSLITGGNEQDRWGANQLMQTISSHPFHSVIFVGIDIWCYSTIFQHFQNLKKTKGFLWGAIFPYDLQSVRKDWVRWMSALDVPMVYSEYGYNLLKDHVEGIRYFRPPLLGAEHFKVQSDVEKRKKRRNIFGEHAKKFIFGFVGKNQIRKDPQKVLAAFAEVKKERKDVLLYMHVDMNKGVYNLTQYALDHGLTTGDLVVKKPGWFHDAHMADLYNAMDCLVNASLQEGLSWTLLEAMLCGTYIIGTDTTAQTELLDKVGGLVECESEVYMPVVTEGGESWVDAKGCTKYDLTREMSWTVANKDDCIKHSRKVGPVKAKEWLEGVSDINEILRIDVAGSQKKVATVTNAVLFAQHSAAGDVYMTTKALKGVKDLYNLPIVYMTMPGYSDIIVGNSNVRDIIPWNDNLLKGHFRYVLNPHGEKILPGFWGRNSNSLLSDFYWRILRVDPTPPYILKVQPPRDITKKVKELQKQGFIVVHTTGGDALLRKYKYMGDVCRDIGIPTVQLGGRDDYPAGSTLDLRGKLSYRQSAWVMSKAKAAVTVDSFMSHLAGGFGIPQVCLFGCGNVNVVRPDQVKNKLICLIPDYVNVCQVLGPCSGQRRDCPVPCMSVHNPKNIVEQVTRLLSPEGEESSFEIIQS